MAGEVDLFAGPGGWDLAARELGLDPLGIEFDAAACATREAAGLRTVQADVSALDPLGFAPCEGLIASPPCQAFSMAGKGAGRQALSAYASALVELAEGRGIDREALDAECGDPRGHLVLEPLRWALALRPRWIACEQVKPVLPLWEEMAEALRGCGYYAWTGVLSAERFGVPQTRERAFMLASLDGPVGEPPATHRRYVPPRKVEEATLGLFDAPEPERIVLPEDRDLLPWVSMAEALGWGMTHHPYPTITVGHDYGTQGLTGGTPARDKIRGEASDGRWSSRDRVGFPRLADDADRVEIDGVEYRERDLRQASQPAFALTEKARSWTRLRSNARANATERSVDEPAPTITGGHDHNDRLWVQNRPATTVAGDPRVFPLGHKLNADDVAAGRGAQRSGAGPVDADGASVDGHAAVRVSLAEALVLQSFPPDYPLRGTRTKQFEQVGNAVPPLLAWAVLRAVVAADEFARLS